MARKHRKGYVSSCDLAGSNWDAMVSKIVRQKAGKSCTKMLDRSAGFINAVQTEPKLNCGTSSMRLAKEAYRLALVGKCKSSKAKLRKAVGQCANRVKFARTLRAGRYGGFIEDTLSHRQLRQLHRLRSFIK